MRGRQRKRTSLLLMGGVASVGIHLSLLLFVLSPAPPGPPPPFAAELIKLDLVPLPPPTPPAPTPKPAAQPERAKAARQVASRTLAPPRHVSPAAFSNPTPAPEAAPADGAPSAELSDAQLAGAASADSGPSGGACDMARRVQAALRKDPIVRSTVAQAGVTKAILVWNGDWVQSRGEDGKGLSAVREAIAWEVGFSPKACQSQPVSGLIVFSLDPRPGSVRLALGTTAWRWSDLLK
jgi:hypothetical protein